MDNNLFYSSRSHGKNFKENKFDIKRKKENTLSSLMEVENFLCNYQNFIRYIKLYRLFRH